MRDLTGGIQSVKAISVDELKERDSLLIDVRESHEFANGTIPGALTLGRSFLEIELKKRQIEPEQPIVLFCSSGLRSKYAVLGLTALNFVNVYSLDGGFEAWKAQGNPVEQLTMLSETEKNRYARHLSLKDVGTRGQLKIMKSKVLVIGAGGLGSSCLLYLAAAGVGEIAVVDHDIVDLGNLQRQVIHNETMLQKKKVESALHALQALNSSIKIKVIDTAINPENIKILLKSYDIVIDCTDNFNARYTINDAAVKANKPLISAAVQRFSGHVMARTHPHAPCYRCIYPEAPPAALAPSCSENGVVGVIPGILGLYQANEALKVILSIGDILDGKLLKLDLLNNKYQLLETKRRPDCLCYNQ
ncbi:MULTISPECIES: molybdopterin-synthase adenylyltransferase MoeB [Photorhabdus]|nr:MULTISPECIES: molybdopterin-synthase adenylyltransferase MoeB [Photorhabdus]MCC8374516.1 molybdopterin-synthase adenylyltransferase MoeB [Photorhabdus bodei]MCT8354350.1 molybdopterin-synthase adenylyltransferase MoeB [Photorhabdus kayaii]MDB6368628.1 molybdopterin-synthase adenylyltransferase MoeB [Photorhabdus bodei]